MNKTIKNVLVFIGIFIGIFILTTLGIMFVEHNYNLSELPRKGRLFIVLSTPIVFGYYLIITKYYE